MINHDNIKHNDVHGTTVIDDGKGKTTHKNEVRKNDNINQNDEGNVTIASDDEQGTTTHKIEVRNNDNINPNNDGNVTIVRDGEQGITTHKNEVRNHNNVGNKSNDVTIAKGGRNPRKTHKSKFLVPRRQINGN